MKKIEKVNRKILIQNQENINSFESESSQIMASLIIITTDLADKVDEIIKTLNASEVDK